MYDLGASETVKIFKKSANLQSHPKSYERKTWEYLVSEKHDPEFSMCP